MINLDKLSSTFNHLNHQQIYNLIVLPKKTTYNVEITKNNSSRIVTL